MRSRALKLMLAIVLGSGLPLGCSILDEFNNIGADAAASKGSEADSEECDGETEGTECRKPANWWAKAQTVTSSEMKSDIVSCRLGGTTQFTSRSACRARGGRPAS